MAIGPPIETPWKGQLIVATVKFGTGVAPLITVRGVGAMNRVVEFAEPRCVLLNLRPGAHGDLTMRLSDAGARGQTKLIYPNHRPPSLAPRRRDPRSLEPIVGVAIERGHDYPRPFVLEYSRAPIRMETTKPSGTVSVNQHAAL